MRLCFRNIHCPPFICFCKPSPHLYTCAADGPLKLENIPHPHDPHPHPSFSSKLESVPETSDHLSDDDDDEINSRKEESLDEDGVNTKAAGEPAARPKSSLKRPNSDASSGASKQQENELKKRVQWLDFLGKQLVDIREFECSSSELEDTDNEDDHRRACICVIL